MAPGGEGVRRWRCRQRRVVRILAVAAIAALSLLAAAGSASARTVPVYTYTGQYYDGAGSTAGTLAVPGDIEVNQTAEKGYVVDPVRLNGSVSQFDAEGNPLAVHRARRGDGDSGPRRRALSVWRSTTRRRHRRATSMWSRKKW